MSNAIASDSTAMFAAATGRTIAPERIQTDALSAYAVDELTPAIAVTVSSIEELQCVLREAHNARLAVIVRGAGTQMTHGNVPQAYDIAVSLVGLDRVLEYEPADMTITVEAGMPLARLQAKLAEHAQQLPLDARSADATVGGMLATGASGPLRHRHGTARDWLIGLRVVHADGTTSKSGGRVVKNVAGYDMHKLHIGALGSLGVIAEATFKLAPLPHTCRTIAVALPSARDAASLVLAARDAGLALDAAELLSPTAAHAVIDHSSWALLLRVAGGDRTVERTLRELQILAARSAAACDAIDAAAWDRWRAAFAPAALSLRVSVAPSDAGHAMELLDRQLSGATVRLSATVTAGLIRVDLSPARATHCGPLLERTIQTANRFGGSVVVDAAPLSLKRDIDVFGPLRPDFAIMQRLKQEFDPERILAPGRFAGRL